MGMKTMRLFYGNTLKYKSLLLSRAMIKGYSTGAGDETLRFWKIFPEKKKEEFSSL